MRSFEAGVQWAGDGQWAALCPVCGATEFINPIAIIGRPEMAQTMVRMALGCNQCGANLDVRAPLYRVIDEREIVDVTGHKHHQSG